MNSNSFKENNNSGLLSNIVTDSKMNVIGKVVVVIS